MIGQSAVYSVLCGVLWLVIQLFTVCCVGCCDWSVGCLQCVVWGAVIGQSAVYSVLCGMLWLVSRLFTVCCVGCCDWSVSCLQCVVWGVVIGQSAVYSVLCGVLWLVSRLLTMGSSSSDSMSSRSSSRALTRLSSWLFSSKTCRFWNTNEVMFNTLHCMYSATTNRHNGYLYSIFSRVLYSIDPNDVKGISNSLRMFCLCNVIVGHPRSTFNNQRPIKGFKQWRKVYLGTPIQLNTNSHGIFNDSTMSEPYLYHVHVLTSGLVKIIYAPSTKSLCFEISLYL